MNVWEKLIHIIYKTATGSRRIRIILTPVAGIIFFIFIGFFVFLSLQTDNFFNFPPLLSPRLHITISIPVLAVGVFLWLWSLLHFLKMKGTPVPFNPPPKLITAGPYGYVRNPMMSGVFIMLFGLGFMIGSISLVFIFTPIFIILNVAELKKIEEPELERRLGKMYVEYKDNVPMFIPKIKRKTFYLKKSKC